MVSLQIFWDVTLYHQLSVSQHFTAAQCLHLQRLSDDTVTHLRRPETCHITIANNNTKQLNITYGWHTFGILSPIRCHEGNGTSITTFLVQLTDSHLRINVQHYTVFKMMVMLFIFINLFSAEYFLAHWLTITCWNEQTQQSICQRITMYVYLQFITDSTDRIRHTSRKWNLQPETSSAQQCNVVCISLRRTRCVALVQKIQRVEDVEMMPAIHITQGCRVPNCSFTTQIQREKMMTFSKLQAINVGSN